MFIKLDTNKDGFLQLEELREGLGKIMCCLNMEDMDFEELMKKIDTDGDG